MTPIFETVTIPFTLHRKGSDMEDPKDPRMSGKIALYALVFLAVLVGLMIWVAG